MVRGQGLGSSVILIQEPHRITSFIATIIRRNRFLMLIAIFCMLLIFFSWYTRIQSIKNLKDSSTTYINDNPKTNIEILYYDNLNNIPIRPELPDDYIGVNWPQNLYHPIKPPKLLQGNSHSTVQSRDNQNLLAKPIENFVIAPTTKHEKAQITQNVNEFAVGIAHGGDSHTTVPVKQHSKLEFSTSRMNNILTDNKLKTPSVLSNEFDMLVEMKKDNYINETFKVTAPSNFLNIKPGVNPSLLIDTPGCKIPRLDPWDPTVRNLIELQNPHVCPGAPLFMTPSPDGSITLNKTVLEKYYNMKPNELVCYYQPIYRIHEPEWSIFEISYEIGNVTQLQFGVPLNEDYVGVACPFKSELFHQYFPLVRLKKEIEEERDKIVNPTPKLNVILVGVDSVSKLNFLRHFPRTYKFINEKLTPFEMNGYTKVGDNTFPNLVPMLTGRFVEYFWNESVQETMYFDDIDLIWKEYAKKGYRTFYAEDNPLAGTFNYLKRGFYNPPTDYYFRPLALAIDKSNMTKDHCLNSQIETDIIYDYQRDFIKAMGNRPHFSFTMVSTITHDKLNKAGWADVPTVRLLEDMLDMGAFNNSLLVLFSDHGLRFGGIRRTYVGKFEERLPLMYIHLPKWFLDQHPVIVKNLKTNQDRLMTLFDIHATMFHLLDLTKTREERAAFSQGTSLFEEISPNRTCPEAYIMTHWCPCQTFDVANVNSSNL
ncbi:hypothetical protein CEXT_330881 [Caerostris extrusa]|uniref:Uncharacterized protein n=1 Tax=Caerostris extrusa TaxID=172846 RepID=A0AAV4P3G4_CAEEX|nr:hypothetical protein CEXT_330881 [Caerostris extrusa]